MIIQIPKIFSTSKIITWILFFIVLIPTLFTIIADKIIILEWLLIPTQSTPVIFIILADKTGLIFRCVVLFISSNVLSFSSIYIKDDKFKDRFTVLVLLFIISINILIFIPHLIILLLGWDGLGLVSFILVIYYQNHSSLAAAILTALTNRIGDVAILLAIALTINQGHWLIINIWSTFYIIPQVILITCAAITKSAQIPFSRWLPAAIAAPTPVSALVHSSTLVTAGVFLIIRFYPFLHIINHFNFFILIISTSTTFIAGLSANTECDFKKIVALSTLSQLGIIIFSIAINIPWLAFFHITTHALFKALLFICVGSIINFHSHSQDLRWIGNIINQIPIISSCIIISNLALCGFPFLAGFYSKDLIIEYIIYSPTNLIILLISLFRLGLTSIYSIRATIVRTISNQLSTPFSITEETNHIKIPTILLSITATIIGSIVAWIYPILTTISTIPLIYKQIPFFMIIIGTYVGYLITNKLLNSPTKLLIHIIKSYASSIIWFLVPLSTQYLIKYSANITHNRLKSIDQGWIEYSRGQGSNYIITTSSNILIKHTPQIPNRYLILIISSLITILLLTPS